MNEYAFDVLLVGAVRVRAVNAEQAMRQLLIHLDAADAQLGPFKAEVSVITDGDPINVKGPRLFEVIDEGEEA